MATISKGRKQRLEGRGGVGGDGENEGGQGKVRDGGRKSDLYSLEEGVSILHDGRKLVFLGVTSLVRVCKFKCVCMGMSVRTLSWTMDSPGWRIRLPDKPLSYWLYGWETADGAVGTRGEAQTGKESVKPGRFGFGTRVETKHTV